MPVHGIQILLALLASSGQDDPEGLELFESKVRPVLVEKCHACHGPKAEKLKGGLRVDLRELLIKGGDSGPALVPGRPGESLLLRAVRHLDPDLKMPPKEKLPDRILSDLEAWIRRGAPMPRDSGAVIPGADFWSFLPPRGPALKDASALDGFIQAKLREKKLAPAPSADPATLLRRVTLDLTGLPPTPRESAEFQADPSPEAYEKAVDRLLAQPAYGDRWGRHWLDLARFTETHGFEYNKIRPNAWPYRDWVIAALNLDLPYDRFVRMQIAGDALGGAGPDGAIAAAFLTCGTWDEVGYNQQSPVMKARVREEDLEDVIATVGQTFLGLTVNCARCHNHKFAPISQSEYYRLKSVFEGVRPGERAVATDDETRAADARRMAAETRLGETERELARLTGTLRERVFKREGGAGAGGPSPLARWTFETDARDSIGALHGELAGGAVVTGGRLRLDGKAGHARTVPLSRDLGAKTLEAWVALSTRKQGGGGVLSIESAGGAVFDALVFAERQPDKWIAGSDSFHRTRDLAGPEETAGPGELVHVAASYRTDGTVAFYRNGAPYGESYATGDGPPTFAAGESRVLFGLRHTGGGRAFLAGEIGEAALYDRALSDAEVAASYASSPHRITGKEIDAAASDVERGRLAGLRAELEEARRGLAALPPLRTAYVGTRVQAAPTRRLTRGDVEKAAETVSPGGLDILGRADFGLAADAPEAERRRRFADWVVDPRNPVAARVIVNRVWHLHFGRGIVGTPNDLGPTGERPTHPELLDALALRFVEDGWSLKKLHQLIVTSLTYRQSSRSDPGATAVDADNRFLWRFSPRRLEAEAIRDSMLAVSGRLSPVRGGPGTRPFDPYTVAGSQFFATKDGPEFDRRTVYRFNAISGKDPLLEAFDAPDPGIRTPDRRTTITPQQALVLLNDPFVLRLAEAFADRLKRESAGDVSEAVRLAHRLAFGREATPGEAERAGSVARAHGMTTVCWALFNASEFLHVR
jgi:hypothetical protein